MFNIFTVYDTVAEFHMQPFFARTKGEAIRSFSQAVNDDPSKSPISAHPEQYELYQIGQFDEQSGLLDGLESKSLLGKGSDFKTQQ